jgi:phosphate uptake regulator
VIYELLKRARRGASYQPTSLILRLIKHKIKITYVEPRTNKLITNISEGVLKNKFFSLVRRAIYIGEDPRRMRGV